MDASTRACAGRIEPPIVSAPTRMMEGFGETTALVTGAQGFIGCWLAERLLDEGAHVVVPRRSVEPRSRPARGDRGALRDRRRRRPRRARNGKSLWATTASASSSTSPRNRSSASRTALPIRPGRATSAARTRCSKPAGPWPRAAARRRASWSPRPITLTVTTRGCPTARTSRFKALYPYDVSKACADIVARSYAEVAGLPVAVTRMANTFGGGDLNWSRIVPDSARALVAGRPRDPLRRNPGARLPLRRGRGRRLPGGRPLPRRPLEPRPAWERRVGRRSRFSRSSRR